MVPSAMPAARAMSPMVVRSTPFSAKSASVTCSILSWVRWPRVGWVVIATLRCKRSEEHTSELQSLMRISYAVFCLKKKKKKKNTKKRNKHKDTKYSNKEEIKSNKNRQQK